jgi:hypothetical protein
MAYIERYRNQFLRFLLKIGTILTFALCAWNAIVAVSEIGPNWLHHGSFWLPTLSCLAFFFFARELALLWKS